MFKKIFAFIYSFIAFMSYASANLDVKARTAILQDYYSGEILYEKEADKVTTRLKREIFEAETELAQKMHVSKFLEKININ